MFRGREHDAVFISDRNVVALEFTTLGKKDKAKYDGEKLRDILKDFSISPEHRYKSLQGFFVTEQEPNVDQRAVIEQIAKASNLQIQAISLTTLRKLLIDTEAYIALRRQAPFGSTDYRLGDPIKPSAQSMPYVEPKLQEGDSTLSLSDVLARAAQGGRLVLTADYGAGKSEALRQGFERYRKEHFRHPANRPFPLHINLRDCYGLRSSREVIRRHAEEIDFPAEGGLLAAWRAGACTLLLDGFDELVPTRWVGGARDLRQVRRQALEPVRRLIEETPTGSGIIVAGRAQYFTSDPEILETLGLQAESASLVRLLDLTADQVPELLGDDTARLPHWLPTRPLLLRFLAAANLLPLLSELPQDAGEAWRQILGMIARREADRVSAITPSTFQALLARVATASKSSADSDGALSMKDLRTAFRAVCGYEADEEGLQVLQRLPGLASASTTDMNDESRRFVDISLADAAYGYDLSEHAQAPYADHPLAQQAGWATASRDLSIAVAGASLVGKSFGAGTVTSAYARRIDLNVSDSILFDLARLSDSLESDGKNAKLPAPFFAELLIPNLSLSGEAASLVSRGTFRDCLIDEVDVQDIDPEMGGLPTFISCVIGHISGWSDVPPALQNNFSDCTLEAFTSAAQTTAGLFGLDLPQTERIALVILQKVYAQAGAGRRESALSRGLPLKDRESVAEVTARLVNSGLLIKSPGKNEPRLLPSRAARGAVLHVLARPSAFQLGRLEAEI